MDLARLLVVAATLTLIPATLLPGVARAEVFEVSEGEDLFAVLNGLAAGDEVILHAGTYATGRRWGFTWSGTEAAPIVIHGAEGEARPVIEGIPSQNVMDLDGSWFVLRHLEITGGSHGLRLGTVDHATFDDLSLHDIDDVAISCNRTGNNCDSLLIRRNEIFETGGAGSPGEGMYLGCNNDACRITNSIIELNYIHDTDGGSQGDGIELKTGSFGNIVRDNVIVRTGFPGILVSCFPDGAGARNIVERNVIWGTMDNGIQLCGQAIVRNNIVFGAAAGGIQSQASQGFDPTDAEVVHNTVFSSGGPCFRANGWGGRTGNVIANNAFYCPGGVSMRFGGGEPSAGEATIVGNVVLGDAEGSRGTSIGAGVAEDLGAAASGAVYPPAGSALIDSADGAFAVADDFDGRARDDGSADVGAYEVGDEGLGWIVAEAFKDLAGATGPGPMDGGMPMPDGGVADGGPADSSTPMADGSSPTPDAAADAGIGGDGGGCSCRVASGADAGSAAVALLVAVALLRRRQLGA